MSKKNKKNTYANGYVSFSPSDIAAAAADAQNPNSAAYEFLDKALTTSSHVSAKSRKNGVVDIDDVYPVTMEECEEMSAYLDQAAAVAGNPSEEAYADRYAELRGIVEWSRTRHWTFKWPLIVGCFLSLLIVNSCQKKEKKEIAEIKGRMAQVDNWEKPDKLIAPAYDALSYDPDGIYAPDFDVNDINQFRECYFKKCKRNVERNRKSYAEYEAKLDTASTDAIRKSIKNSMGICEKSIKEETDNYNKLLKADFKDTQEIAKDCMKLSLNIHENRSHKALKYFIFLLILVPLYIISSHQWGYVISRHRTETKVLGGLQKVFFTIAAGLFGAGLAMELLPDYVVETTYADGHKTRTTEANTGNALVIGIKIGMMIAGLFVYCFISVFIMIYATFFGLKRNYDWKALIGKVKKQTPAEAA